MRISLQMPRGLCTLRHSPVLLDTTRSHSSPNPESSEQVKRASAIVLNAPTDLVCSCVLSSSSRPRQCNTSTSLDCPPAVNHLQHRRIASAGIFAASRDEDIEQEFLDYSRNHSQGTATTICLQPFTDWFATDALAHSLYCTTRSTTFSTHS